MDSVSEWHLALSAEDMSKWRAGQCRKALLLSRFTTMLHEHVAVLQAYPDPAPVILARSDMLLRIVGAFANNYKHVMVNTWGPLPTCCMRNFEFHSY